ncbi:MAG: hypothetical protein QHC40_07590 [Sphingobium sp.]|nr:hypothetical protein [Sphingobium sp.]
MTDEALAKAKAKREELLASVSQKKALILDAQSLISRFEGEIAELDHWINMWHRITGTSMQPTAAEHIEIIPEKNKPARPRNPDRQFVVEQVLEIIQDAGKPLSRRDLFDALATRGIEIRGKDPEMVLSTMLWRTQERIVRIPPHGYWPKEVPFIEGGYDPDLEELFGSTAKEPEGGAEADDAD